MIKSLSKIARELNGTVSLVVEFLRVNGYAFEEDPNEVISDDIIEFINNNFSAFLAEKNKNVAPNKKQDMTQGEKESIPLELKIIESASKEKKLIERIIGFTEFDWNFIVAKYNGECVQPIEFTLFDEVLCDLLLVEKLSTSRIGEILGFDPIRDPAEKEIVEKAISELQKDKMVETDGDYIFLTETGKEYAKNGVKFSTFKRNFELYFDLTGGIVENARNIFANLKSEKTGKPITHLPVGLNDIQKLAEHQAPEIHFPSRNYLLKAADFVSADAYKAKVWVVLLENFRDNTLRTIVYEEKQGAVIDTLSEFLDAKEDVKAELLNRLIKVDDTVEFTNEEKKSDQLLLEEELIKKQKEIDQAIDKQDISKLKNIEKEVEAIRRHFNSLEFEVELKHLFDNTADDLWIISPWIKFATLKRIPFFEHYLKKGGRIFVAYSEPEESEQVMAYEEPLKKLQDLERKYQNFYLHQLPPFHFKNVWLRRKKGIDLYYTGSYNILSFFVSQQLKHIRQEKMTRLDWNDEVQAEFLEVIQRFGLKYVNKAIEDFNLLCQTPPSKITWDYLQKLRTVDNSKLKPFLSLGIEEFDKTYHNLEDTKAENLKFYRRKYFESQIAEYAKRVTDLAKQKISIDQKKKIQVEFEKLRDEHIEFLDLQMGSAKVVAEAINNLPHFIPNNSQAFKRR